MECEQLIKLSKSKKLNENLQILFDELMALNDTAVLDLRFYKLLKDIGGLFDSGNEKHASIKDVRKSYLLAKKRAELFQDYGSYWDLAHFYLKPQVFTEKYTYDEIVELAEKAFKEKDFAIVPSVEHTIVYDGEIIHYRIDFCARYDIRCLLVDSKGNPRNKILIESYKQLTKEEVCSLIQYEKTLSNVKTKEREELEQTRRINQIADNYKDPLNEIENMFFAIQKEFNFPVVRLKLNSENSCWGICYPDKKLISLSTNLVHRSKEYIRYVIIHEYCHLYYCDHSINFWREVEKRCPEYRKYEDYYKRIY